VFYNLNPLTLLLIKKKRYTLVSPARAKTRVYISPCSCILPFLFPTDPKISFYSPLLRIGASRHFISIRYTHCSYPVTSFQATSLSAPLSFYSPSGSDRLASLKQLNKPRAEPDRFALCSLLCLFCALFVVACNSFWLSMLLLFVDCLQLKTLCAFCLLGLLEIKRVPINVTLLQAHSELFRVLSQ
jgi:hypothetical protein